MSLKVLAEERSRANRLVNLILLLVLLAEVEVEEVVEGAVLCMFYRFYH